MAKYGEFLLLFQWLFLGPAIFIALTLLLGNRGRNMLAKALTIALMVLGVFSIQRSINILYLAVFILQGACLLLALFYPFITKQERQKKQVLLLFLIPAFLVYSLGWIMRNNTHYLIGMGILQAPALIAFSIMLVRFQKYKHELSFIVLIFAMVIAPLLFFLLLFFEEHIR